MASQKYLDILKQGAAIWNQWREKQEREWYQWRKEQQTIIDFQLADLSSLDLSDVQLNDVNLNAADLSGANLSHANLERANLSHTNLSGANLERANISFADLSGADLKRANLERANLYNSNLSSANLSNVNLSKANLSFATLAYTNLDDAKFHNTRVALTIFADIDLSSVQGLDTVEHRGPSAISINTLYRSKGNISDVFLKGAGIPHPMIEYVRSLVGKPIDYYTCFISYSSRDEAFAKRLYADLQNEGVRCWYAPEDLRIGDKFWHRIDESIRLYDKLLVVLSQNSVESEWVEREVMSALEKERQKKKLVLFPVTVDEAFMQTDAPWAADIRRTRHVGDFRNWKSHDAYQKALDRLLRDLKSETQKMASQDGTTNGGEA